MKNVTEEIKSNFLGANAAVIVGKQEQFEKLIEFMSIKNLFLEDGNPVRQLNIKINTPIAFYRDPIRSFIRYDSPSVVPQEYKQYKFEDVFMEQTNLFGDEGLINPNPIMFDEAVESEARELSSELSLNELIGRIEIDSVVPAAIRENVTANKELFLDAIRPYENIVVTEDNYEELKTTRAMLSSKKKEIENDRKRVKDEASKNIDAFISTATEIINAFKKAYDHLNTDIRHFEDMVKEKKKEQMMNNVIRPVIEKAVAAGIISQKYADMFVFDSAWLNASAVTKTGNLTAKTKEAVNTEFNRVLALYQQSVRDIETIRSTIDILSLKSGLEPGALNPDTYVEIYENGKTMPEIQLMLNEDIERLTKAVEKQIEKKAQELASKAQTLKDEEDVQGEEKVGSNQNIIPLMDEKTGEVVAKYNGRQIFAEMAVAPAGYEDKDFSYTYSFSGPCAVIMTLNRFLKLLSKVFPQFKYERLGN